MKLGIMQPYFFPYIGYFQLMNYVDKWIVFNDIQFIDKGWINRNRILHPDINKQWQYLTVPLTGRKQFDKITDISIKPHEEWRETILGKLSIYKKKAPFYDRTREFVADCLMSTESNLSNFVSDVLIKTAKQLSIQTPIHIQTNLNLDLPEIMHPGEWALRICEKVGADEYINPHSGYEIFEEKDFEKSSIKLNFIKPRLTPYIQRRAGFVPGLSIIDVMMWNNEDEIHDMLVNDFDIFSVEGLKNG